MNDTNKTIVVVGVMISFVINTIMFGWEATRKTADELVKITSVQTIDWIEVQRKAKECVDAGGLPDYFPNGNWENCNKK